MKLRRAISAVEAALPELRSLTALSATVDQLKNWLRFSTNILNPPTITSEATAAFAPSSAAATPQSALYALFIELITLLIKLNTPQYVKSTLCINKLLANAFTHHQIVRYLDLHDDETIQQFSEIYHPSAHFVKQSYDLSPPIQDEPDDAAAKTPSQVSGLKIYRQRLQAVGPKIHITTCLRAKQLMVLKNIDKKHYRKAMFQLFSMRDKEAKGYQSRFMQFWIQTQDKLARLFDGEHTKAEWLHKLQMLYIQSHHDIYHQHLCLQLLNQLHPTQPSPYSAEIGAAMALLNSELMHSDPAKLSMPTLMLASAYAQRLSDTQLINLYKKIKYTLQHWHAQLTPKHNLAHMQCLSALQYTKQALTLNPELLKTLQPLHAKLCDIDVQLALNRLLRQLLKQQSSTATAHAPNHTALALQSILPDCMIQNTVELKQIQYTCQQLETVPHELTQSLQQHFKNPHDVPLAEKVLHSIGHKLSSRARQHYLTTTIAQTGHVDRKIRIVAIRQLAILAQYPLDSKQIQQLHQHCLLLIKSPGDTYLAAHALEAMTHLYPYISHNQQCETERRLAIALLSQKSYVRRTAITGIRNICSTLNPIPNRIIVALIKRLPVEIQARDLLIDTIKLISSRMTVEQCTYWLAYFYAWLEDADNQEHTTALTILPELLKTLIEAWNFDTTETRSHVIDKAVELSQLEQQHDRQVVAISLLTKLLAVDGDPGIPNKAAEAICTCLHGGTNTIESTLNVLDQTLMDNPKLSLPPCIAHALNQHIYGSCDTQRTNTSKFLLKHHQRMSSLESRAIRALIGKLSQQTETAHRMSALTTLHAFVGTVSSRDLTKTTKAIRDYRPELAPHGNWTHADFRWRNQIDTLLLQCRNKQAVLRALQTTVLANEIKQVHMATP